MGWPQITMIVMFAVGIAIALVKHGESKGEYSFGITTIAVAIEAWVLYMGGFFN